MNTILCSDREAPAWSDAADPVEDLDEPPEIRLLQSSPQRFRRTAIRQTSAQSSLLTKAIMGTSDEDAYSTKTDDQRRRSMTSNISIVSTADLTSDTGLTSPCRTNTPSPPIPEIGAMHLDAGIPDSKMNPGGVTNAPEPPVVRKRCIQFACAARPLQNDEPPRRPGPASRTPSAQKPPTRPCIKFTHPWAPGTTLDADVSLEQGAPAKPSQLDVSESPSTPKRSAGHSTTASSPQPASLLRPSSRNTLSRPKFLRANSKDLVKDSSQFHEFASGTVREEEWIRQGLPVVTEKLTINDTLTKENRIRRLGAEAEEEALEEEAEDAELDEDDPDENDADEDEDGDGDEDADEEDENDSDGYYTDEETGFADSDDDENDDDENMRLWTPSNAVNVHQRLVAVAARRSSLHEPQSDSSIATDGSSRPAKTKRAKPMPDAPDLPDSTDFVCGTLDEDRPLEEAYKSCLAARRSEKLRIIPQDIDPSFPASDPDDDDDDDDEEDTFNAGHHDSDPNLFVHGEMEDLHHGEDRSRRRRSEHGSPRKYRSPAPKRRHSPAPKPRNRSPKPLFGRQSPRRARSPAPPRVLTTPVVSPRLGAHHVQFQLAGRPNTTHTKSLPRPAAVFPQLKKERVVRHQQESDTHVRGAIDIFKGLERKRQRCKEKFYQKYCNRARRGQIPERKPQPGRGAERMKEIGLVMAGKKDQGNYVLSI